MSGKPTARSQRVANAVRAQANTYPFVQPDPAEIAAAEALDEQLDELQGIRSALTTPRDPGHYRADGKHSWFRDKMITSELGRRSWAQFGSSVDQNNASLRLIEDRQFRAVTLTGGAAGLNMPQWLAEEFAPAARVRRVLANLVHHVPIPVDDTREIDLGYVSQGIGLVPQGSEGVNDDAFVNSGTATTTTGALTGGTSNVVPVASAAGIVTGTVLTIDTAGAREVVTVLSVAGLNVTLRAPVLLSHLSGVAVQPITYTPVTAKQTVTPQYFQPFADVSRQVLAAATPAFDRVLMADLTGAWDENVETNLCATVMANGTAFGSLATAAFTGQAPIQKIRSMATAVAAAKRGKADVAIMSVAREEAFLGLVASSGDWLAHTSTDADSSPVDYRGVPGYSTSGIADSLSPDKVAVINSQAVSLFESPLTSFTFEQVPGGPAMLRIGASGVATALVRFSGAVQVLTITP